MSGVKIYDSTLRDGNQAAGISFSLEDKLLIAEKIDSIGIDYVEGGWPNPTNTTDVQFYKEVTKLGLKARIAAFGSTCRPGAKPHQDPIIKSLTATGAPVITVFGKSWDLHVTDVIKTSLQENLRMIKDSVAYLKKKSEEVIYDAEHFFDGFKANPEYALDTLKSAAEGGADCVVLCDTNGGTLPLEYAEIVDKVREAIDAPLGVHNHNDAGMADANSIVGVNLGCVHVQGTMNGFGERCGNANLSTIIPNLKIKLGENVCTAAQLRSLRDVSVFVNEIANIAPNERLPFVSDNAFSHKGGAHIDGVLKVSRSFEHVDPALVGNERRFVLSDQSGGATIVNKLKKRIPGVDKKDPVVKTLLSKIKAMEHEGYTFEAAEGSFFLIAEKERGRYTEPFVVKGFRVIEEKLPDGSLISEATIRVEADGKEFHTAADGDGPVNAMDKALRKALVNFFPSLASVHLVDYKVRVLDGKGGTSSRVHVLIESSDGKETWGTVGVSENIIEASWIALVDSLNYKLMSLGKKKRRK